MRRSIIAGRLLPRMVSTISELILAVSIKQAAQNLRRPSTQCLGGSNRRRYASRIYRTSSLVAIHPRPLDVFRKQSMVYTWMDSSGIHSTCRNLLFLCSLAFSRDQNHSQNSNHEGHGFPVPLANSLDPIRRNCSKSSRPSVGLHQINCEDQHSLALVNTDGDTDVSLGIKVNNLTYPRLRGATTKSISWSLQHIGTLTRHCKWLGVSMAPLPL